MTDDPQARPATHGERDALLRVVWMNAKLAKDGIALREAQLMAKADEDVAAAYRFGDDAWAEITRAAEAAACKATAVPRSFWGSESRFVTDVAM
jgi:hypothetical protein